MTFAIKAQGLDREIAKSIALGANIQDFRDTMRGAGHIVLNAARPITPHDTGALKGSFKSLNYKNKVKVMAGENMWRPYARWQYFGTIKNRAHFYFTRAAESRQALIKQRVDVGVKKAIKKSGY